eukprot:TRINITY_DN932_c0_g2_i1.p1 TRINITY_DN932_c0_g2~~TRINITY_DN932_c0_g2_i1.p1  ORF type:complete len:427 (+),score=42.61 TRINITY_DN932_c0_g2_i1:178-1458(+)
MWRCLSAVLAAFFLFGSADGLLGHSDTSTSLLTSSSLLSAAGKLEDSKLQKLQELNRFETCAKQARQGKSKPVIGVLTVPNFDESLKFAILGAGRVWKPYVQWLEAGDADVVPLPYELPDADMTKLLSQVNGVLIPGGHNHFYRDGSLTSWGRSAMHIWNYVVASHHQGKPLPLWGTCLGFEFLHYAAAREVWVPFQPHFDTKNVSLKERFRPYATGSRLMNGNCAAADLQSTLASEPVAYHTHVTGVKPGDYDDYEGMRSTFNIVSTSHGPDGHEFVSMVEGKDGLPVYGTQWHPEKTEFLSSTIGKVQPPEAIAITRYFSHFFVEEARRNHNQFASPEEKAKALIGNYVSVRTPIHGQVPDMYYIGKLTPEHYRSIFSDSSTMLVVLGLLLVTLPVLQAMKNKKSGRNESAAHPKDDLSFAQRL